MDNPYWEYIIIAQLKNIKRSLVIRFVLNAEILSTQIIFMGLKPSESHKLLFWQHNR
jgi:hypothetical protein